MKQQSVHSVSVEPPGKVQRAVHHWSVYRGLHSGLAKNWLAATALASVPQQAASQLGGTWLHVRVQYSSVKVGHRAKNWAEVASDDPTDGDGVGGVVVQQARQFWSVSSREQMALHHPADAVVHVEK